MNAIFYQDETSPLDSLCVSCAFQLHSATRTKVDPEKKNKEPLIQFKLLRDFEPLALGIICYQSCTPHFIAKPVHNLNT